MSEDISYFTHMIWNNHILSIVASAEIRSNLDPVYIVITTYSIRHIRYIHIYTQSVLLPFYMIHHFTTNYNISSVVIYLNWHRIRYTNMEHTIILSTQQTYISLCHETCHLLAGSCWEPNFNSCTFPHLCPWTAYNAVHDNEVFTKGQWIYGSNSR